MKGAPPEYKTWLSMWIWSVNGLLHGIKHGNFLVHPFLQLLYSKIPRVIHAQFFPLKYFISHVSKSYKWIPFQPKTHPWKFHNQHWVKCTQNNSLIDWEIGRALYEILGCETGSKLPRVSPKGVVRWITLAWRMSNPSTSIKKRRKSSYT